MRILGAAAAEGAAGVSWVRAADMPVARKDHAMLVLQSGDVIALGGLDSDWQPLQAISRYIVQSNTWTPLAPSGAWSKRSAMAAAVLDDASILVVGGQGEGGPLEDVIFSIDGGLTWEARNATSPRQGAQLVQERPVLVLGGTEASPSERLIRSDDRGRSWTSVPATGPRWGMRWNFQALALEDGRVLVMGGDEGGSSLNDVWLSADAGETWEQVDVAHAFPPRSEFGAVELPNGRVAVIGGVLSGGLAGDVWVSNDTSFRFWHKVHDYSSGSWLPRQGLAAAMVHTGSGSLVVITGGYADSGMVNDTWAWQCRMDSCPEAGGPQCYLSGWEAMEDCKAARGVFSFTCDDPGFSSQACPDYHVYDGTACRRLCNPGEREDEEGR